MSGLFDGDDRPDIDADFTSPGVSLRGDKMRLTGGAKVANDRIPGIMKDIRGLSGASFAGFRDATLANLRGNQSRSTSDLRDRLRRRKIAGGFGERELARKRIEDDQQEALTRERIGLAELDFRRQALVEEHKIASTAVNSALQFAQISGDLQARLNEAQQEAFESDRARQDQAISDITNLAMQAGAAYMTGGASLAAGGMMGGMSA